jgi:dihydrolipoamide dehydrogenase
MTDTNAYDVAVLGGGSGGYAAAIRSAQLGSSVAIVEADAVGGTCLHRGCVPTKALLRVGEVADLARDGARYGLSTTVGDIDMAAVHAFKNGVVDRFHTGLSGLLKSLGITVVDGFGRLRDARTIDVDGQAVTADAVVLATGSAPKTLPGIEIGGRVLTSDEALTLDVVPSSVVVLGGGVIGVEFASLWASLGARVTIVEALPSLLTGADADAVKYLTRGLKRRKIGVRTGAAVSAVVQDSDGITVTLGEGTELSAEYLLVAVGRRPRTEDLGLDAAGVECAAGFVQTDARMRTTQPGVYAVGDIVAGPQLAHRGFAHGMFVAEEIAGMTPDPVDDVLLPRVTYSHPEVASVGLTEAAARERFGDAVRVSRHDLAGNAKSVILNASGMTKVVTADDRIVGVHMVGDRVGEMIGEAQVLCGLEATASRTSTLVHAHPSQGEALGEAIMAVAGRPLHGH